MKRILTREDKLKVAQVLWDRTPEKVGPFDGGCLALALALERLGGQVMVLTNRQDRAQHAVARFGRWLVDYNGAFSDSDMIEFFSVSEHVCISAVREFRKGDLDEAYDGKELVDAIVDGIGEGSRLRLVELTALRKTPGRPKR